ncbi:MAG: chromosome segregation protein ScpA [Clostridiales bacterium]|nr:chromosome segregation protein ScpA [Clostridiales bacterium]
MQKEIKFESNVDYLTKLDNFDFEGPLDLLLHLIKEAKIEIKDVFVSSVTDQFLQYIERNLEALDIDKASEYLTMAATLLEIKSKSLLPKIEDIEIDIEDPEQALIRKVEEYKLFKETAEKLKQQENANRFYKEPDKNVGDVKVVYTDFNINGLVSAFSKLLLKIDQKKAEQMAHKEIPKDVFTVEEKVQHIRTCILDRKSMSFYELFENYYSRNEIITTFQALLELLKLQYVAVEQNTVFDDITIILKEDRNEELGEIDEYN